MTCTRDGAAAAASTLRPAGVPDTPVSIGPHLRALAVYLVVFQHVPIERCRDPIADVAGAVACSPPSAASATAASTWKPSTPSLLRLPAPLGGSHAEIHRLSAASRGWGRIDLAVCPARAGKDWTDDGTARQQRGLKHRTQQETRSIPIPPVLVQMLCAHLKRYGTVPDGRIFQTARGGLIQGSAYSAVWQDARAAALTPAQQASPLARRPYDLRHAGVSLALNAGVPATEVARRAGQRHHPGSATLALCGIPCGE